MDTPALSYLLNILKILKPTEHTYYMTQPHT